MVAKIIPRNMEVTKMDFYVCYKVPRNMEINSQV